MIQYKTQVFDGKNPEMEMWTCDDCGEKSPWFAIEDGYPQPLSGWKNTYTVGISVFEHHCAHCVYVRDKIILQHTKGEECAPLPAEPRVLAEHKPVIHHPVERKCLDQMR